MGLSGKAAALLAIVLVLSSACMAAEGRVSSVTVTGVSGDNLAAVERILRVRSGDAYSEEAVQDDLLAILDLPFVQTAKVAKSVSASGVDVVYVVAPRGAVKGIYFTGNRKLKTKKLLKEGRLENVRDYDPAVLSEARDLIIARYKKLGYLFAKVDYASQNDGSVLFKIDEGPRLRVSTVNIIGNTAFDDAVIKRKAPVRTKTRKYLVFPYRLDEDTVEGDRISIQEFYRDAGYLDAQVGISLNLTADGKGIVVDYLVTEGPLYKVRSVSLAGNSVLSTDALQRELKMTAGQAFSSKSLNADVRAIRSAYGRAGYIDCQVAPSTIFAADSPQVDVSYNVAEGGPVVINEVGIYGNDKTRDHVIRRDLEFAPGETFNTDKIEQSRRNLRRQSFFSKVDIAPAPAAPGTSPRDVNVNVEEIATGRFIVGAAINSNAGLMGRLAFEQRNFDYARLPRSWRDIADGRAWAGGGQYFELDAQPGTELSQMRMFYKDPRVADSDYSLGLDLHLWERERNSYAEKRTGAEVSVGKQLTRYAFIETGAAADNVKISGLDVDAPNDVREVHGSSQLDLLKVTVGHDTRDNTVFPTEGHRLAASLDGSSELWGSEFDFARARLDGNWYHTLSTDKLDRPSVLAWRSRLGYLWPSGSDDDPIFERFFCGGAYDVRGFEYRGLGPRSRGQTVMFGGSPIPAEDEALGGRFLATGTMEYEFPLAGDALRGAVFLDSGTLLSEPGDLALDQLRFSTGFGIRFNLPAPFAWPVVLDFGFPIKKDSNDQTQVFSFSLGRSM